MKAAIRAVVDWCTDNPREAVSIAGVTGSVALSAGAAWLALWLTVRDHTGALEGIKAQQEAQTMALTAAESRVVAEQRRAAEEQRIWQAASLQRDLDLIAKLAAIDRSLGVLQGQLQRAAMYQGWRIAPKAEGRQFEGSGVN